MKSSINAEPLFPKPRAINKVNVPAKEQPAPAYKRLAPKDNLTGMFDPHAPTVEKAPIKKETIFDKPDLFEQRKIRQKPLTVIENAAAFNSDFQFGKRVVIKQNQGISLGNQINSDFKQPQRPSSAKNQSHKNVFMPFDREYGEEGFKHFKQCERDLSKPQCSFKQK